MCGQWPQIDLFAVGVRRLRSPVPRCQRSPHRPRRPPTWRCRTSRVSLPHLFQHPNTLYQGYGVCGETPVPVQVRLCFGSRVSVRSSSGVQLVEGPESYKERRVPRDASNICRAMAFSHKGNYFAWTNGTRLLPNSPTSLYQSVKNCIVEEFPIVYV